MTQTVHQPPAPARPAAGRALIALPARGNPVRRLICLPYSGAGRSAFRGWERQLPADTELLVWVPPGREHRSEEQPYTSMAAAAAELLAALRRLDPLPYTLFGHSMGAMAGYALCAAAEAGAAPRPHRLVLSGCAAPGRSDRPTLHDVSDARLLTWLRELGATPGEILDDAEAVRLFLPAIRADLTLVERYAAGVARSGPVLDTPLTTLAGRDDAVVAPDAAARWQERTRGGCDSSVLPGGHFFLHTALPPLMRVLTGCLPPVHPRHVLA
ncbi:alpha/beta fold hydrolase [Streptomyces sp. NPDC050392]|uniref:thioesterase II family protein n=1 Tax=Streptomyces sp. NPDC050392 TaxID=3155782 RepID=UPI003424EE82